VEGEHPCNQIWMVIGYHSVGPVSASGVIKVPETLCPPGAPPVAYSGMRRMTIAGKPSESCGQPQRNPVRPSPGDGMYDADAVGFCRRPMRSKVEAKVCVRAPSTYGNGRLTRPLGMAIFIKSRVAS
jgi:hypothetical protein